MGKHRAVFDTCIWRCMASGMICACLHSPPAHAVWEYSLAAQIAINDGIRSTCGKIEPRLGAVLDDELAKLVQLNGAKAISSARKSSEYFTYIDWVCMNISKLAGAILKKKPMNAKAFTLASVTETPSLINGGATGLAQTCH
ncbi:hypothetical protein [Massilia rhizosphaerae]|uniref:hypothetical protein n=1 Tax=Massilia rhizosphaerae TaxID=2784389 RepID=UPI0018DBFEBC|nr:hypothetical protein [Massilia rhizosphaerae]